MRRRLQERAALFAGVRAFFNARGVVEVDTPIVCAAGAVDEHLEPIPTAWVLTEEESARYLVTSPELSMKRLLAAGSGPIFQLTRAFRRGERGRLHNPEFTILEWYRPEFDHHALMSELEALVQAVLPSTSPAGADIQEPFERLAYAEAFERELGLDPHAAPIERLEEAARDLGLEVPGGMRDGPREDWLDLLLVSCVEPCLGVERPTFVYDYPAAQAALARIRDGSPPVAERFELYIDGIELANGYHELTDPEEQRRRFIVANQRRRGRRRRPLPLDERFFAALADGLPKAAGVAVGLDRVLMLRVGARSIDEVLTFPIERA